MSLPDLVGTLLICIHNIALFMHHLLQSPYGFCSFTFEYVGCKMQPSPPLAEQEGIRHGNQSLATGKVRSENCLFTIL